MPKKCMAQMPVPITRDPANHQVSPIRRWDVRTRRARSSVTKDASTAITNEAATTSGSWLEGMKPSDGGAISGNMRNRKKEGKRGARCRQLGTTIPGGGKVGNGLATRSYEFAGHISG
ncbi:hypothetical protein D3C72_1074250 [compost metagenome]